MRAPPPTRPRVCALPTPIRNGLDAHTPSGAAFLADSDLVTVHTAFGLTTYSATFKSAGIRTTVSVDSNGNLASLPSITTVDFSTIPAAAQAGLQAMATAAGFNGTISGTQQAFALDEANGTTLYTVRLLAKTTNPAGHSHTAPILFTVDQLGNPTMAISIQNTYGGCF